MSIKSSRKRKKAAELVGDLKLIRIKIQDLPTDTVAQSIEHRRDKPKALVQIQASVRYLICPVVFFHSLLPWRSVGRSNFDRGLQYSMLIEERQTKIKKQNIYKII